MRHRWVSACCLPLAWGMASPLGAQTAKPASSQQVVARVGDRAITLDEIEQKWRESDAASFIRLSQARYEALQRYVDLAVGDRLIAIEAKARGISPDELLRRELPARTKPVTDAEIEATYHQLGSQMQGRSLDQMREPIRAYLKQQRPAVARARFVAELKTHSTLPIRILLEPPRQQIAVAATDPVKGPASAPVEIIEFSDFQ